MDGSFATGLVLLMVGAFLLLRTIVHDAGGKNLVDRIVEVAK